MEPAHFPIVLAQVSEITAASDGLTKGGLSFICAVLGGLVWAMYREIRTLQAAALTREKETSARVEKLINDKLDLYKEITPLIHKLTDSVQVNGQIAASLTRE